MTKPTPSPPPGHICVWVTRKVFIDYWTLCLGFPRQVSKLKWVNTLNSSLKVPGLWRIREHKIQLAVCVVQRCSV